MPEEQFLKIDPNLKVHSSSQAEWTKATAATILKGHPFTPGTHLHDALGIPGKWAVSVRQDADGNLVLKKEPM